MLDTFPRRERRPKLLRGSPLGTLVVPIAAVGVYVVAFVALVALVARRSEIA